MRLLAITDDRTSNPIRHRGRKTSRITRRRLSTLANSLRLFAGHWVSPVCRVANPTGNCRRVDSAACETRATVRGFLGVAVRFSDTSDRLGLAGRHFPAHRVQQKNIRLSRKTPFLTEKGVFLARYV